MMTLFDQYDFDEILSEKIDPFKQVISTLFEN